MTASLARFDISFWNLDGLEARALKPSGEVRFIPVQGGVDAINHVAFLNHIVVLRDQCTRVQTINPSTKAVESFKPFYPANAFDFAPLPSNAHPSFRSIYLYLLDRENHRVQRLMIEDLGALSISSHLRDSSLGGQWPLGTKDLNASSRIAVVSSKVGSDVAYIGPVSGKKFLTLTLDHRRNIKEMDVNIPIEPKFFGDEVHLCVDGYNGTLIISDTMHHRLVEVDYETGEAEVICGTGAPGMAKDGEPSHLSPLNLPRAIALYRPGKDDKVINKLTESSLTRLAHSEGRPRTIFIADSGNYCVKKLIQFPLPVAQHLGLADESLLCNFVGTGQELKGKLEEVKGRYRDDLRMYAIKSPMHLAVSMGSELLIGCQSTDAFLLLRPATLLNEKAAFIKTRNLKVKDS